MAGPTREERRAAQDKINDIMADRSGPYWNPDDPRNRRTIEEMTRLHGIVHAPGADNEAEMPPERRQALDGIEAVDRDASHPFWNMDDPGHAEAVAERAKLFAVAYPEPIASPLDDAPGDDGGDDDSGGDAA